MLLKKSARKREEREGTYKYDVVFMNEARDNSYYLVVRGSDVSSEDKSKEPYVQRCVELAPSAMVMIDGSPANNVLPEPVLRKGVLEMVKEKGRQYEQIIYNIYWEK